tara:strand:- start:1470 stop:3101 length:1632 start_codon:yes stop_codon:yes gene_type:complete
MAFKRPAVQFRLSPPILIYKGIIMLSMSKLREQQKWILWTLLFFFVASMTVGGLVGGANIVSSIQSFFGKVDTRYYVGKVGNEPIPISYYLSERQIQLNRMRNQGRSIDSRAQQNAGDFAWNNIIERVIKDNKIEEFNLKVQDDEIYNFLLLSPPPAFQDNLKTLGLFTDEENNFNLDEYQTSVRNGLLPDTTQNLLVVWENYLRTYLADRKLQNVYNNTISISDYEVKDDYILNNTEYTLNILNIKSNSIADDLITISDEEILLQYDKDKESKYKQEESITLQYKLWKNINSTDIDSLDIIDMQDSLLQLSIDFASEAQLSTFSEALEMFEETVTDTIKVTENFTNNSGIPFQMGVVRQAVRFAFDNSTGSTSDSYQTDNGLAVFNILGKNKSTYTELNEVKNSIERTLKREKKLDYALNTLSDVDLSLNWESISENEMIEYLTDIKSTLGGSFKTVGKNNSLIKELKNMKVGDVTDIISSRSNVFVAKLIAKDSFDVSEYNKVKDSLKIAITTKSKNQIFNQWMSSEKDKIEIKDLRSKIF